MASSALWDFTPALRSPRPLSAQAPPFSSYCFPGPSSSFAHVPDAARFPCLLRACGGPLPEASATLLSEHLSFRDGPHPFGIICVFDC